MLLKIIGNIFKVIMSLELSTQSRDRERRCMNTFLTRILLSKVWLLVNK